MDGSGSDIKQGFDVPPEFWDDYKHFIIKTGVRLHKAKFYVYWVRQFMDFLNNMSLHECRPDDVTGFLRRLQERKGVHDWQIKQARNALRLLFML